MIDDLLRDESIREDLALLRGPSANAGESSEEVLARVAWSVVTEPGDGVAGALVAEMGASAAWQTLVQGLMGGLLTPRQGGRAFREGVARWRPRISATGVGSALRDAARLGARLLLPGDDAWPEPLGDLGAHTPFVLWVRGEVSALRTTERVGIVGARAATSYGEQVASEIAGDLAATGVAVISGGAYGIDGAAHRAALGVGGTTVAVLAGGVDRAYPQGHRDLLQRIAEAGAVVSEVPCGTAPTKWRFLSRNRLIAALGDATVVVEAGWRSGSLNTAGHAATLGRPLGAVPGPVTSPASAGCHRLLREYDARCVTTAEEVRELWRPSTNATSLVPRDSPEHTRLLDAMSARTAWDADEVARRSGISPASVRALLGVLELEGSVQRTEHGWKRRTSGERQG
ncbi:DNA-processing protein DprA [Microbacterium hydrocarbonoxydans]|uniref:DNA-processing protein DprA n=1 Tax=Microbacterium hydrocarbonoxydans TaxID=273678 RepID=UPI00203C71A3|nr:DNA-processing protein DprA [Microbacterium hydrocarbonoxydans]MCM3778976.1 DNA-processing protein DprA [Microbacterium hydrocarbonoxydans]